MEFDLENPFTNCFVDEEEVEGKRHRSDSVSALFAAESDHMSSNQTFTLDFSLRRDALSFLLRAQFACNLDPFVTYLAVNYVDRFLSRQEIPRDKPWIMRLLSVSCLSLASKMKKTDFSPSDFQREEGFIYDTHTIQRMELLVLGALKWRMRSITPFSFLHFFVSFFCPRDPPLITALKARASNIVIKAQNDMKLSEYKPSVMAASALLTASYELFPVQFRPFRTSIFTCSYVNKEKVVECCNAIWDLMAMDGCDSTFDAASSCGTPVTVLVPPHHRHCSSSESEERTAGTVNLTAKKRRIGGLQHSQAWD